MKHWEIVKRLNGYWIYDKANGSYINGPYETTKEGWFAQCVGAASPEEDPPPSSPNTTVRGTGRGRSGAGPRLKLQGKC